MLGKQILEVCTIVSYWVLFVPLLLKNLKVDLADKPFDYFFKHANFALYLILGYLVLYRIVCYIFIYLKSYDLGLWHSYTKTKVTCEMKLEEAKSSYKNLDDTDGPPAKISFSTLRKQSPSAKTLPRKQAPSTPILSRKEPHSSTTLPRGRAGSPMRNAPPCPPPPIPRL